MKGRLLDLVIVDYKIDAPMIALSIQAVIDELPVTDDYCLSLQLDYRDCNTIFFLDKVKSIYFNRNFLEIVQVNGSYGFFKYDNILEYCVLNIDDVVEVV